MRTLNFLPLKLRIIISRFFFQYTFRMRESCNFHRGYIVEEETTMLSRVLRHACFSLNCDNVQSKNEEAEHYSLQSILSHVI